MPDTIEEWARRAFALAINCHTIKHDKTALRPNANEVEFNFVGHRHYELRIEVGGSTYVGGWESYDGEEPPIKVVIEKVFAPDGTTSYPNFEYIAFWDELGPDYAKLYEG